MMYDSQITLSGHILMIDGPTIRETTLRELTDAGSVDRIRVVARGGGYAISVFCGASERTLATTRGEVRLFSLDAAAKYLRHLGCAVFEVDASRYEPGRLRKARPDRAEALRATRKKPRQAALSLPHE